MAQATTRRSKPQTTTEQVTPLYLRAEFDRASADEETRTAKVIWSTGAKVLRRSWIDGDFYEELSLDPKHVRMTRLNSGAPLLDSHNQYDLRAVLGVIESAELQGKKAIATVRFAKSEDSEDADRVFRMVRDGILQNISVGYRVYKFEKVEGGAGSVPTFRAVDWEPFEISVVAMGADAGAGFRSDKVERHTCEFVTRSGELEKAMAKKTQTDATEVEEREVDETVETTPAAQPSTDASRAAVADLQKRNDEILKSVRALGLDNDVSDGLIRSSHSLDECRALIIDAAAKRSSQFDVNNKVRVEVGADEQDKRCAGITNALMARAGITGTVAAFNKTRGISEDLGAGEFSGISLLGIARRTLQDLGVRGVAIMSDKVIAGEVLKRSAQSRTDFSVVLENLMHKTLQSAYATTPDTWSLWCKTGSVTDFRPHNRYRRGAIKSLDKVLEDGEFKNRVIPDAEKGTITIDTYGNIIGLSRQAIIDDDLGAFSDLSMAFGRAAKRTIEELAYATLLLNTGLGPTQSDTHPLFHANRSNVGTGAAIGTDSLEADRVILASQKDPAGHDFLDLRPAILLLPIGLGGKARVYNQAQYDPDASQKYAVPNKSLGLFSTIVDTPRLTGTRRYMFADPNVAPVFEVAFLDGVQEPFADSEDGWRSDGVEWKVRIDVGCGAVDWRGGVTNAGQ